MSFYNLKLCSSENCQYLSSYMKIGTLIPVVSMLVFR